MVVFSLFFVLYFLAFYGILDTNNLQNQLPIENASNLDSASPTA